MVGRLQGKAEIVHGENIFPEFGLSEVADASGLPGPIEFARYLNLFGVEVVIVLRFVDPQSSQNNRRMVPVTPSA